MITQTLGFTNKVIKTQAKSGKTLGTRAIHRQLRILMVTPRYFPSMGGVENHVYQVTRRLAHAGVDVTVLTSKEMGALMGQQDVVLSF